MSINASWARLLPAFQILLTPTQLTALAKPFSRGVSATAQSSLPLRNPKQHTPLQQPQAKVEGEAEQTDEDHGQVDETRVERVARHRDDLPEPVTDADCLGDQHHHPGGEQIETKHHEQAWYYRRENHAC